MWRLSIQAPAPPMRGSAVPHQIFAFAFTDIAGGWPSGRPPGYAQCSLQYRHCRRRRWQPLLHLVDLIQFTGGAIFKATEIPHITAACPAVTRANRVVANIPAVGLTSFTPLSTSSVRLTNFSSASPGTAGTITAAFGNIVGIATGQETSFMPL